MLTDEMLLRYSRQIMLPQIDLDGQEALLRARVLIVGLGGLGSPVSMYLAAAGVGHLTLADFDVVDLSNLQRQIVHTQARVGINKAISAAQTLAQINSATAIDTLTDPLDADALLVLARTHDLVVDCTDNFATRFAINAACVAARKPLVSGAAIRLEGQVAVFDTRKSDCACYRCLFDEDSDDTSCVANGILSPVVGIVGSTQALEAIKLIAMPQAAGSGFLSLFNALTSSWQKLKITRDPACPVCATRDALAN